MVIKCGRCENGRKYQEALAIVDVHIPFDFPYRRRHPLKRVVFNMRVIKYSPQNAADWC